MSAPAKILFLGLKDCSYSERAYELLRLAGMDTQRLLSGARGEALPDRVRSWQGDYILCFRSYFILPKALIDRAHIAAINFHPAPPDYPGSGCVNLALYDGAKTYGVTAHVMNEKVDNGPIIHCRRFPIFPQDTVSTLLARTLHESFGLFCDVVNGLFESGADYLRLMMERATGERWAGSAHKISEIDRLQRIGMGCSREQLERIIRATYTDKFRPFIELHDYRFVLEHPFPACVRQDRSEGAVS